MSGRILNPWQSRGKAAGEAAQRWCAVATPEPLAEISTLLAALHFDARWCEQLSIDPNLPRRDRARLRRLARRIRQEMAALTPKPRRP